MDFGIQFFFFFFCCLGYEEISVSVNGDRRRYRKNKNRVLFLVEQGSFSTCYVRYLSLPDSKSLEVNGEQNEVLTINTDYL